MPAIDAIYFDGQSARRHDVRLHIREGRLFVEGAGVSRDEPIDAVEISEPLGHTPRLVRFPDRAVCEVADLAGFARLLSDSGMLPGAVSRWEGSGRWIAGSAIAFVLLVWAGYRYGLPLAASFVAARLPPAAMNSLGAHVLTVLDRTVFEPSEVSIDRRTQLRTEFERLNLPGETDGRPQPAIVFRRSRAIGANAFALPSGDIVLTDDIVALAADDRELLAVLAHEAGHVERRHSVRHLLQNSVVALLLTWYVGDVGSLAAAAPTALLQAKYSREFEREADEYAAAALRRSGIPLEHLSNILQRLERSHGGTDPAMSYLSTHPTTKERLENLRR